MNVHKLKPKEPFRAIALTLAMGEKTEYALLFGGKVQKVSKRTRDRAIESFGVYQPLRTIEDPRLQQSND